jgi:hypothetical protein
MLIRIGREGDIYVRKVDQVYVYSFSCLGHTKMAFKLYGI